MEPYLRAIKGDALVYACTCVRFETQVVSPVIFPYAFRRKVDGVGIINHW